MIKNLFHVYMFEERGIDTYDKYKETYPVWNKKLDQVIDELRGTDSPYLSQKAPLGSKKPNLLYDHPELKEFKEFIQRLCLNYAMDTKWTALQDNHRYSIELTASWVNILNKGEFQHSHVHPDSQISGVYFHKCEGDEGQLVLYNPVREIRMGNFPENLYTCGGEYPVKLEPNMVICFPSWLEHKTMPNLTDKERITVAFNATIIEVKPEQDMSLF